MGFSFVTVGGDTRFVTMGAAAAVQEMRGKARDKSGARRQLQPVLSRGSPLPNPPPHAGEGRARSARVGAR